MPALITGDQLVTDFKTAFIALSTADVAAFEAARSEQTVLEHLSLGSQGAYLNPSLLSDTNQIDYKRASLDAHIKKIQAQQVKELSANQLQALVADTPSKFQKRAVRITVRSPESEPIEAVWFDQKFGQRSNVVRKSSVVGSISSVLLDKNAIVIRPAWLSRLLMPSLKYYVAYVINPATMDPMISVELT
jgi:hypothetical protein